MAIYEGVWYNHDTSKLVLTLSPTAAGFLSAAIVTFVNLVATATWPIFRYMLYGARGSIKSPKDVFHHQRQVMLRNSDSAAGATMQLFKMMFGWRSYKVRAAIRSVLYTVICLAIFVLWLICGLYAPYIYSRTGSDVLLAASPNCGGAFTIDVTDPNNEDFFDKAMASEFNEMNQADIYVQQCYGDNSNAALCHKFPSQALPFTMTNGTACPFGPDGSACVTENATTITLDTGYLDTNHLFGINVRAVDRVQYRRVTTCSPLHTRGWVTLYNTSGTPDADAYDNALLLRYYYGPDLSTNYTLVYNSLMSLLPIPYTMSSVISNWNTTDPSQGWVINSTFYNASDADISIMFIENNHVTYPAPVLDPVFRAGLYAEDAVESYYNSQSNVTMYEASYFVSPIGCKEQHQLCLGPNADNCTPLMAVTDDMLYDVAKLPGSRATHICSAGRITQSLPSSSIQAVTETRGSASLLAYRTLNGVLQTAMLPEDQWVKEVVNWHSIALAHLQARVLQYATGPSDPFFNEYVDRPTEDEQRYACEVQRIPQNEGYVNYDMKGLAVLIVLGFGLCFLGATFETIVTYVAKRRKQWQQGQAAWLADGLYHLHKTALEVRGVKEWHDTESTMPKSKEVVGAKQPEPQLFMPGYEQQYQREYAQQYGSAEAVSLMHTQKG